MGMDFSAVLMFQGPGRIGLEFSQISVSLLRLMTTFWEGPIKAAQTLGKMSVSAAETVSYCS